MKTTPSALIFSLIGILIGLTTESAKASLVREELRRLIRSENMENSCSNPRRTQLNIAHRGNESEYMENSLPAFASAAELGSHFSELDVVLTKDNQTLVFHDTDLTRTSILNCPQHQGKKIRDLTAQEIQQDCRFQEPLFFRPLVQQATPPSELSLLRNTNLDLWTPPLLSDVLELMSPSKMGLLIEFKTFAQQGVTYQDSLAVLDVLASMDPEKKCESEMPSREDRINTYQCYQRIQMMSFDTHLMDFLDQQIKTNPKYHRLYRAKLLKLVYPSAENIARLTDSQFANSFWNLDGVAFGYRFGTNGAYDESLLDEVLHEMTCLNHFSNGKLIYVWTAHSPAEIDNLKSKPIDGLIHSRPRYLKRPSNLRGRGL